MTFSNVCLATQKPTSAKGRDRSVGASALAAAKEATSATVAQDSVCIVGVGLVVVSLVYKNFDLCR